MPFATTAAWSCAGALAWVGAWGLGAWFLGRDIHGIASIFHRARPSALVATALAVAALLAWIVRGRRRAPANLA